MNEEAALLSGRDERLEQDLARLDALDLAGLRAAWRARAGPPPKLRSPELLRLLLAWDMQVQAYGGVGKPLQAALKRRSARAVASGPAPGVRISREWRGQVIDVEVIEDGVLWQGSRYASLSEVARAVTGARWNGPRFFGLRAGEGART